MTPADLLTGKRIVVSGASRGLGRAFALALAEAGAAVVVNGTDADAVGAVVDEIRLRGGRAASVVGSVAEDSVCEGIVACCIEEFGGVDVAISNAAITRDRTLLKSTPEEFDATIAVNLRGAWSLSRHAARAMQRTGGGHLLLVISAAAFTGSFGQTSYAASKAGLLGMMHTWDVELRRHGIRVNAFGPTASTDMTQDRISRIQGLARRDGESVPDAEDLGFATPAAVAPAVVYLCSDLAAHLSAQVVRFDGRRLSVWAHPREAVVIERPSWDVATIASRFPPPQPTWTLTPGGADHR